MATNGNRQGKSKAAPSITPAPTADAPLAALAAAEQEIADEPVRDLPTPQPDSPAPVPALDEASANPAEKETSMNTEFNNAAETAQNQASTMIADAKSRTEDMMGKSTRMFEDMNAFAKGNVEAVVESSKIAARGFETLGQDAAENARKAFEEMTAAIKTMASVKSPTEFMKLQGDYARQAFDAMVQQSSQSTERMMKLAGEVAQPISNRIAVAGEKMKIAA